MGKGWVVIARSVNNDFEPLEKLTNRSLEPDGPRAERAGVCGPLAVDRSGRYRRVHGSMSQLLLFFNESQLLLITLALSPLISRT